MSLFRRPKKRKMTQPEEQMKSLSCKSKVTHFFYNKEGFLEETLENISDFNPRSAKEGVGWLNIDGLGDSTLINVIGEKFNLHPLTLEDITHTEQRPKVEGYREYLFVVLKMLMFNEEAREISVEQVSLVLGRNYVISFQETVAGDVFKPIRDRIRKEKTRIRRSGADYLLYALIDAIVDHYFLILEEIGNDLEDLEENITKSLNTLPIESVHNLKRELLTLRKAVWPLRELVNSVQRGDFPMISKTTMPFLRDLYDHTVSVIETIEGYRDLSSSLLEMHMTMMNVKMNEIMKFLTMIATIFIPITFFAGVWGMNFKHMPEIEWPWGYVLAWAVMLGSVSIMLAVFKIKKWF